MTKGSRIRIFRLEKNCLVEIGIDGRISKMCVDLMAFCEDRINLQKCGNMAGLTSLAEGSNDGCLSMPPLLCIGRISLWSVQTQVSSMSRTDRIDDSITGAAALKSCRDTFKNRTMTRNDCIGDLTGCFAAIRDGAYP